MKIELIVELLIPDTTAVTAFNTLKSLGFNELKKLKRADYYSFDVNTNNFELFSEEIGKVDILVNANKHRFSTKKVQEPFDKKEDEVIVIVKDIDNPGSGVLKVLKERLGLKNINSVEKGVLWKLSIEGNKKEVAEKITRELLCNEHYQGFEVF